MSAKEQLDKYNNYADTTRPKDDKKLSCGAGCTRISLIVMNIFFMILGTIIVGVGAYALNPSTSQIANKEIPAGAIVLGVFVILLSFLGCCGAKFNNRIVLCLYALVLVLLILIQIIVASVILANSDQAKSWLQDGWEDADPIKRGNAQKDFDCCGLRTYNDSFAVQPCPEPKDPTAAPQACLEKLENEINKRLNPLGAIVLTFAFLQISGVIFALCLRRNLNTQRYSIEDDVKR